MTETARHADIVLPVAGWLEVNDLTAQGTAPNINYVEQCVPPLYESKGDYEICQLLAEGMGKSIPWMHDEFLAGFLENPTAQAMGITYEELKDKKTMLAFPDGLSVHGAGGQWGTPTGKIDFYIEQMAHIEWLEGVDMGDAIDMSMNHLAHFETPHEAWPEDVGGYRANELAEKYPLVYTSMRNRFRTHTQFYSSDWLLEVTPDPSLRMNPDDAAVRGIEEGDLVRVFNDRGEVVLRVELHAGIRPGMVVYPKGWQEKDFVKGHCSDLTSCYSGSAIYNSYHFDVLCEVEKYQEA